MSNRHSSEMRWADVLSAVSGQSDSVKTALISGEEVYQELLEVYTYSGGTPQGFADLIFKDVWQARSSKGVRAVMTFDVVGGIVTAVTITQAGTGYNDGAGFNLNVVGGNANAIVSYDVVNGAFTNAAVVDGGTGYTNGTGQVINNIPDPTIPQYDTEANADEVAKAQDAIDAMTAIHQLYLAATDNAVAQSDRLASLRRMS